eukprot:comp20792_c0_seq1/m.27329 comp20792_c0_seq1/g.27329  ORF comp20792_c0_seq1/g.27329 comp20792_c0_seq1/m.27329 type:complete len:213 (-) comp20792_c0_seq1:445-1083(-)
MSSEDPKKTQEAQDGHDEDDQQEEHDPHYDPIVSLPTVEVKTLEENEEAIYTQRAKLFRFDANLKEWKERGTGEIKLLKHKEKGSIRVLMRRDKTLKICANHHVYPSIELSLHPSSDRAYVYNCPADYADEEMKPETFAIRFGSDEKAKEFKKAFDDAREANRKFQGTSAPPTPSKKEEEKAEKEEKEKKQKEEEEEITEKLEKLEVKGEEK